MVRLPHHTQEILGSRLGGEGALIFRPPVAYRYMRRGPLGLDLGLYWKAYGD